MRKWILLFVLAFVTFGAMRVHADTKVDPVVWLSSYTDTNDTTGRISCSTVIGQGGCRFHGIVVDSSGTASSIIIYNSSSTAVNTFTTINTTTQGFYPFDVYLSSGLVYTTSGAPPAKINILYAKPTIR
jgi:hypothetical protein